MLEKQKKTPFILGTRGSMLALTQAHALLAELREIDPNFEYETKVITTQGDQITDKPLWQLEGKDFFTKELDESLLSHKVDMVIHSLKDLSSTRPEKIDLIAISKRTFPNDILFFKNEVVEKIRKGELKNIVVGTSSPRRVFQIQNHLNKFIPHGSQIKIETKSLRGNVNTRINKLLTDQYDAICLAFAGVERIAQNQEHQEVIHLLRDHCQFMLLSLHSFTPSPGQGALAVEACKTNPRYKELKKIFLKINSENDRKTCLTEKKVFAEYGGNCHLALGVFSQVDPKSNQSIRINGIIENKVIDQKKYTNANKTVNLPEGGKVFIGLPQTEKVANEKIINDQLILKKKIEVNFKEINTDILLFTSQHTIPEDTIVQGFLNFSAGEKTSAAMANKGIWIHGTLSESPFEEFQNFCSSHFLKIYLDKTPSYKILSHKASGHSQEHLICSYQHEPQDLEETEFQDNLKQVESFYWTSFSQFKKYQEIFPFIKDKSHYCGVGRTYQRFQENKITNVTPVFGISHLKKIFNL